ncbi:hypothetical protein CON64_22705 [Bacillus pseudomycoides]|nr:hypothetical protein CON64_22705 [Bacillus pseudomycoides]
MIKELTLIGSLLYPVQSDVPPANTEASLMEQLKQIEVAKEEIKKREEIIFKQIEEERQKREEEKKQRIEEQKKKEEAERIKKEMEKKQEAPKVVKEATPEVKREENYQETNKDNWQEGRFSAYYAANNTVEGGLISATGHSLTEGITFQGYRIIAAPPAIPFYSIVEIEVNGWKFKGVVLDRGGAIKGNKFDILHRSSEDANAFGKQSGKYRVIGTVKE